MEVSASEDGAHGASDDQLSQETAESSTKSPSPPPQQDAQDDFLMIVPKPTLLSKEKAKKRLQAFNQSKLNAYYNNKKKQAESQVEEGAKSREVAPAKKQPAVDAARLTIEEIEKCKQEQVELLIQIKVENKKLNNRLRYGSRRRSASPNHSRRERHADRKFDEKRARSPGKNGRHRDRERNRRKLRERRRSHAREPPAKEEHKDAHHAREEHHRDGHRDRSREHKEHKDRDLKNSRRRSPHKDDLRTKETNKDVKEKTSWSDYGEDYYEHPEEKEIKHELVDVRKMMQFSSACYNIRPYQYKSVDGALVSVPGQSLRFTTKASPRIVYSPNPNAGKSVYFQRDDVFATVSKPQKDGIMSIINQASEAKPIAPIKPPATRNWYLKDSLQELHADDPLHYDPEELAAYEKEAKLSKGKSGKSKKSKRKSEREERRKKRKARRKSRAQGADEDGKMAGERPDESARQELVADADSTKRKRTDTLKSDTNSINSNDNDAPHNHVSSMGADDEEKGFECSEPKTPPLRHSPDVPFKKPRLNSSSSSSGEKNKNGRCEQASKNHQSYHVHDTLESKSSKDDAKDRAQATSNCKTELPSLRNDLDFLDIKSYSKKPVLIPFGSVPTLTTPTKIYKIKNDCLDKLKDTASAVPIVSVHNLNLVVNDHAELPELRSDPPSVPCDIVKNDEKVDNKAKSALRFESIPAPKEPPIEKLKTKPSELYSPTLQSLPSESSTADDESPAPIDYKSRWESEEDLNVTKAKASNCWESEDEAEPIVIPRETEKPKVLQERSLEMPLNINIGRPRSQIILPKEKLEVKLFDDLEGPNSWDIDSKHSAFDHVSDANDFSLGEKPDLENEYMQFMSSVTGDDPGKQKYSSSSDSASSSSSSSSSGSASSSDNEDAAEDGRCTTSEVISKIDAHSKQASPVCNVDSTSSPAIPAEDKEPKPPISPRKPIQAIVLAKKSPLVDCNLFRDEDSETEDTPTTREDFNDRHEYKSSTKGSPYDSHRQSPSFRRDPSPRRRPGSAGSIKYYNRSRRRSPTRRASPRRADPSPRSREKRDDVKKDCSPRGGGSPRRAQSPRKLSPRRTLSPRRCASPRRGISPRRGASPRRGSSPRRGASPRRMASPRRGGSPRRISNSRSGSPRRISNSRSGSPRRISNSRSGSPKHRDSRSRDNSPRLKDFDRKAHADIRRREGSPRQRLSPRRRSPRLRSRSPKHEHIRSPKNRDRSPRSIDLPRHREYEVSRNRDDRLRDRKYRDGSPRFRESPSRFSPTRRRPSGRYSPKRERSPRYRDRSPRRRSLSPSRRMYSRSNSKERKHESITQALHRIAGMDYEPPKSPGPINSPMEGYIRGVPDSTISDEQLLQNRSGEFHPMSPVFFNAPFKPLEGSPKRIPLDDRINQVLGIDSGKQLIGYPGEYYNQAYYDQYGNTTPSQPQFDSNYKQYGQLVAVNNASNKVVQVGNVLQVVPTEQQQQQARSAKKKTEVLIDPNTLQADAPKKFVSVGNMLEIVPTTELPKEAETEALSIAASQAKLAEELLQIRNAERKAEREKRRVERDRRRKDKEMKRKERELRRQQKFKLKSELMIKKALMYDANEDLEDEPKVVPIMPDVLSTKAPKGILVIRERDETNEGEVPIVHRHKKSVKFADGVLPGEGTSPSGGEELSSPPPFSKVPKEKRYTKTKKPKKHKSHKKKIKVKIVRKSKKSEDEDTLPPPSPPPGSPPPHVFPPRVKPTLINPAFYTNYHFNPMNCAPFAPDAPHPPFPGIPNMQFSPMPHLHLPPGQPPPMAAMQPMHSIPLLLPPPASSRLLAKPIGKLIDKGM